MSGGGAARVASELCEQLADQGHTVTVLAPARRAGAARVDHPGVDVRRVLHRHGLPEIVADPLVVRRAARRFRPASVDVAIAHSCTNALGLARAGFGGRLLYVFHASAWREARLRAAEDSSPSSRARAAAAAQLLRAQERSVIRRARTVVALSAYSADLLTADNPGLTRPARVVAAGIDPAWFTGSDRGVLRSTRGIAEHEVLRSRRATPRDGTGLAGRPRSARGRCEASSASRGRRRGGPARSTICASSPTASGSATA